MSKFECILCGSTKNKTKEDVLPNWVRKFAMSQGEGLFFGSKAGHPHYAEKRPPAIVKFVCRSCNEWMNEKFEIPTKPILESLFKGESRSLPPTEQEALSCWIAKTMLIYAASGADSPIRIPHSEYERFRDTGAPPKQTRILIGAKEDAGGLSRPARPVSRDFPASTNWTAYRSNLLIGHLVMQYLQIFDHNLYRSAAETNDFLLQIWPPGGKSIHWPPSHLVTSQNFLMLDFIAVV